MTYNNIKKEILNSTTIVTQREISFRQRKTWLNTWQTLLGINNTVTKTTHRLRYTLSITLNTKQTLPEITKYITALLVKEVVV